MNDKERDSMIKSMAGRTWAWRIREALKVIKPWNPPNKSSKEINKKKLDLSRGVQVGATLIDGKIVVGNPAFCPECKKPLYWAGFSNGEQTLGVVCENNHKWEIKEGYWAR